MHRRHPNQIVQSEEDDGPELELIEGGFLSGMTDNLRAGRSFPRSTDGMATISRDASVCGGGGRKEGGCPTLD